MSICRGIRGATLAEGNTAEAIYSATRDLLKGLIDANDIEERDVAAVHFSMTPDLNAVFPAAAARQLGWNNTALMGSVEIAVPDSLSRCIRVLILFNTVKEPQELMNLYLNGTDILRMQGIESI